MQSNINNLCLCGSTKLYAECCEPFHKGGLYPQTAEELMRSRFVAFEMHLKDYLLNTWYESTRPGNLEFTPNLHWTKLTINGRKKGRKKDSEGWVTFTAYYQQEGSNGYLHEKSYFIRDTLGHWQYVDGEIK
ncbi:YchJ family protein [Thiomicrorhabdus sp.]|uniref:YchJ family protein n=1 Tax=Thiomicrorhabdus sp. TaxID=2039724 RepID=UPI002AA8D960|nr:YchJ family metal-binding protein [Thiomicrorhabdus sp.]